MPKHAPPKSLRSLAFENIIKNVDVVWTSQYVKDWGNKHLMYVEGPFDCLTPSDCHWILSELAMRRILKRHHIYLLINPYLKILNLSDFRDASKIKLILDLALTRCRNSLKKIVLKFSQDFSTLFMPYLEILNNLTELELPNTRLNNNDVGVIGIHASKVKLLNLMDTRFSDNGLRSLFLPVDPEGNADQAYGQCQQVEILDVRGVEISPQCSAEIYTKRENKWKLFRVDKTFNAIMECLQNNDESVVQSFKTDYVSFSPMENDEIKLDAYVQGGLVLAPDASDIHLYDIDVHEESHGEGLALVQHFNKIKSLTLDVRQDFKTSSQDFIFDKGITPILLSHGNNLTFIMFTFVRDLDLGLLVSSCSNLEQLRLQFNIYSNVTTRFQVSPDWPLKNLVIQCCSHPGTIVNCPDQSVFKSILAGAKQLETFVVSYCNTFTDDVFIDASHTNPFNNLTDFMMTNCKNITMKALEGSVLMKTDVPLKNVLFFGCDQITLADFTRYQRYIETNQYKVQVQWQ